MPDRYDAGGYTGANMDRPALKRLLADVEAGRIQCVVVYKVDRLTRSLLDFSRIVETVDSRGVTFVSVTQQFNTTTSLGRLTLNILLSFAQFERDLISERTRDKMSAARRKGKWVGGNPVLGYDVAPEGGRLLVNEPEAERVRAIYEMYLQHGALMPVVQELERRGWRMKRWASRDGRQVGGALFTENRLYNLLTIVLVHIPRLAADESFVNFNFTREFRSSLVLHSFTNPVKHKPSGLLRNLQVACDLITGYTILAVSDHPRRCEPLIEAKRRVFKDSPNLNGELLAA